MFSLFSKVEWALYDCVSGTIVNIDKIPFEIGSDEGVDLKLAGSGVEPKHCAISKLRGIGLCLVSKGESSPMWVNGEICNVAPLKPNTEISLQIGSYFFAIKGGKNLESWKRELNHEEWFLYQEGAAIFNEPLPLANLCRLAIQQERAFDGLLSPRGLQAGFFLHQAAPVFGYEPIHGVETTEAQPAGLENPNYPSLIPQEINGALTCPVCWLSFNEESIMHVAVHDSLRDDPVLGPDAQQRFYASRFNDRGQALDAFGIPCPEIACPHCRRILPSGFLDSQHHLFSIVGDQSAGKSYFLSVLAKTLPDVLYKEFGVRLQDADPTGNAMLNEMKRTLFSARTPAEARLAKTQLEGAMYERLPRYGRIVALPKPFVFSLEPLSRSDERYSIIFYDNAGEHFQPGRDSADSPGTQHIASSSGIFFLFDPFNEPEFRRRISSHPDPQHERPVVPQQEVILSELRARLKKLLQLSGGAKLDTPLALMVGKSDAWTKILAPEGFQNPVRNGHLDKEILEANSMRVRSIMLEICPAIVANAEAVSSRVQYFPVSSFGHSPIKLATGDYVPDPSQLSPRMVEVPCLWVLSLLMPDLIQLS